ncbi:MAG: acyltransferase domain-containing protein, partial [Frankia sp.]
MSNDRPDTPAVALWPLSAPTRAALRSRADALRTSLSTDALSSTSLTSDGTPDGLADVAYALARSPGGPERAVVFATPGAAPAEAFGSGLAAVAAGRAAPNVVTGRDLAPSSTIFVFPGQGGQWDRMGADLLATSPVFAARIRACDEVIAPLVGWSVADVLRQAPGAPPLRTTDVIMPALYAVMVSLAAVWESWGIRPDAVVGHSLGEAAAAHVAGALSLADGALVAVVWGRALQDVLADRGGMLAVPLDAGEVARRLDRWAGRLVVASVTGPGLSTVAGEPALLAELNDELAADGIQARPVAASYAGHSAQIDEIRAPLVDGLAGIAPRRPAVPVYAGTTGGRLDGADLDGADLDGEYWWRNLRSRIRFESAVRAALADHPGAAFVEISPHPVLTYPVSRVHDGTCVTVGSLL